MDGFEHDFCVEHQNFNIFVTFFGELPLANQALKEINLQTQTNKKYCTDLFAGSELSATALWGEMNKAEQNAFHKEFDAIAKSFEPLGLSDGEILLHCELPPKMFRIIAGNAPTNQRKPPKQRKCLAYLADEGLTLTNSLSFVHFLLGTADIETLTQLSKSPKACQKVTESLFDPVTLRCFSCNRDIFYYKKIFKIFPQLAGWRDQHNNTLLHYALALNTDGNPKHAASQVMEIITSTPQLRASNTKGVSLRDMCHAADSKLLANYDKKTMTRALKSAGLTASKPKAVKRKI